MEGEFYAYAMIMSSDNFSRRINLISTKSIWVKKQGGMYFDEDRVSPYRWVVSIFQYGFAGSAPICKHNTGNISGLGFS